MIDRRSKEGREYIDPRLLQTTIRKRAVVVMLDSHEVIEIRSEHSKLTGEPVKLPGWLYQESWEWDL